jgi:hypothetical protein
VVRAAEHPAWVAALTTPSTTEHTETEGAR